MATSGDYDFTLNAYQIITGALRLCGAIQTGETPAADEYDDCLKALNGMVTQWQASGIHVWCELDGTLFLQPDQIAYDIGQTSTDHCALSSAWVQTATTVAAAAGNATVTVSSVTGIASGNQIGLWLDSGAVFWTTVSGAPTGLVVPLTATVSGAAVAGAQVVSYASALVRPLRMPAARSYLYAAVDGQAIETPMSVMARLDYAQVPNKTTPGVTTQFFYDPQRGPLGRAYVWPAPSNAARAMKFTGQRPIQDFVSQANDADLPQEWTACLRFGLAREIALEYDVQEARFDRLSLMAAEKFAVCSMWDREPQSVYFGAEDYPAVRD